MTFRVTQDEYNQMLKNKDKPKPNLKIVPKPRQDTTHPSLKIRGQHDPTCNQILEWAQLHGWLATYFTAVKDHNGYYRTPLKGNKGYPDLTLAGYGHTVHIEVKTGTGRLEPDQKLWKQQILKAKEASNGRVDYFLARPENLNELYDLLKQKAKDK